MTTIAVTGGTGFVGAHLLRIATEQGREVRALTRRPQAEAAGVEWVAGDLTDPRGLCAGADAVIHIAGIINARTRREFDLGNVDGTRSMIDAALAMGVRRFVHVSPRASPICRTMAGRRRAPNRSSARAASPGRSSARPRCTDPATARR